MDYSRYTLLKQAGATSIIKNQDGVFMLEMKQFDPNTGKPIDSSMIVIDVDQIEAMASNEQKLLDSLNLLLSDLKTLLSSSVAI